ncbi:hypothetical protein, partial [Vibrio cholerae]|uniref:hypothetical protein n=1 Tax=Vibrio cholerae TaxID=666 RepID=UPI003075DCE8
EHGRDRDCENGHDCVNDRVHDDRHVHDDVHGKQEFRLAVHRYENGGEHHRCYGNSGDER